ncbi:hypothetical protein PS732_04253 [Pseudomonas fluorescens]|uniref:Phage tail protein n=1 Tax=Pseudomonas fluorescens TaxID=294 RepID=A0ABD7VKI2_PSEFL|nr:hypothetical protein [Pseudomonas fluorescens]VVP28283.1 hypothetical protein PS732_04253 [Pseudomonas fluorescens]
MSMKNITIRNCGGVGMSVPQGFSKSVAIDGLDISNCAEGGFVERDPISVMAKLGLPPETPYSALLDALNMLQANSSAPSGKKAEIVNQSQLGPILQKAANATSIVKNMVDISSSPKLQQLITMVTHAISG